ncbi:hypothetical protein ACFC34_30025 [Streptomyces sp. NPDC056053]|uniref:hypothetical protein n=1 Tax=Streptomyces sp. NPDC056053 TaxID=3345696 RepID=UPI0035E079DD
MKTPHALALVAAGLFAFVFSVGMTYKFPPDETLLLMVVMSPPLGIQTTLWAVGAPHLKSRCFLTIMAAVITVAVLAVFLANWSFLVTALVLSSFTTAITQSLAVPAKESPKPPDGGGGSGSGPGGGPVPNPRKSLLDMSTRDVINGVRSKVKL